MTSLHYTLIALGAGLVVAMVLYNLYQERRSRKQAERIFGLHVDGESAEIELPSEAPRAEHLDDGRIEPRIRLLDDDDTSLPASEEPAGAWRMADEQEVAEPVMAEPPASIEPKVETPPVQAETPRPAPAAPRAGFEPESPLDGAIEYVARLRYSHPTPLVFATLLDNLRRISKPIRLVGRREDGNWEPVLAHANRPYDTVELSILLADRSGPVSEVQLDTFCRRLYEFAAEHGGAVSCQEKPEALERARRLDAFCAEVDMLIGLNVVSASGLDFSTHAIHEVASRAGLVHGPDGTYSLRDADGRQLFTLATHNEMLSGSDDVQGTQGLSLLFDVPRVAHGLDAFDRMSTLGFELASRLGGQLVDDGGRPVSHDSLMRDRRALESIYTRMEQHSIPAGGERALRLFA